MSSPEPLIAEKSSRKFKPAGFYIGKPTSHYYLMPFRFHRLENGMEILVNEFGDFVLVPYDTVQKIVARQLSLEIDSALIGDLVANFFISETATPPLLDVMATRYRTKKSFLDNFTSLHIFVISLRCEHTCQYCQVSRVSQDKSAFDMSIFHIDKGIDMMMRSPNPHVTMEFQGGEALLAFDKIKYAIRRAATLAPGHNKTITNVICTNLAPLNSEIIEFCLKYDVFISTSLDGPEHIHNKNRYRPGNNSHQMAIQGIQKCREVLGYQKVSALLTTTNLSLQYPEEIVNSYYEQGFRSIFLRPISPYGFATHNGKKNTYLTEAFLVFYKKALNTVIEYNLAGQYFREDYATIILRKMLTPFPVGYVDLQSPAGMINNVIVFNYDGKIYATDEARMLAEMKDFTFQLGSLDDSSYEDVFYGEKAMEFSKYWSNESLPGCSECAFQAYCGADPVFNYTTQGTLTGHRPTSAFCKRNMSIIEHLFVLMNSDKRIEKIFRSWINDCV